MTLISLILVSQRLCGLSTMLRPKSSEASVNTDYVAVAFTILFTVATSTWLGGYMPECSPAAAPGWIRFSAPLSGSFSGSRVSTRMSSRTGRAIRFHFVSNVFMWLATWTIVTLQQYLPLNPDGIGNMEPTLAFNTISSFVTNTNLQHYSGETGLSYVSQIFTITFLQFVTAATGVAAAIATIRGLAGNRLTHLGNFYADMTRATIRLFLPLAVFVAVLVMWQGAPQTFFEGAATATTLEGAEQKIARGVTAGVVSIKQLGTNGGATSPN